VGFFPGEKAGKPAGFWAVKPALNMKVSLPTSTTIANIIVCVRARKLNGMVLLNFNVD
jgi:hypothetical protein